MKSFLFLAVYLLSLLPASAQGAPFKRSPPARLAREKAWIALSLGAYASATLDMRQTEKLRQEWGSRFIELNPLERPLVGLPKPAYYALKLSGVTGANWLGWKMKHSERWYRHIWWLPQVVAVGGNAYGYTASALRARHFVRWGSRPN